MLAATACGTVGQDVEAPPIITAPVDDVATPSSSIEGTPSSTDAETDVPDPPELEVVITQIDCPDELFNGNLACALATVPIDRDNIEEGTTDISIAALRGSDSGFSTPVAVLQGGPGGASTELTTFYPQRQFTQVFVDQRGTGFGSTDFDCPEVDDALPELLSLATEPAIDLELEAYRRCAERLESDPVLDFTNTESHAADVADVMNALGYSNWVAYGVSYGTTIVLELMRDEVPGLSGAILDGVFPPELDLDEGVAETADLALAELDRACATSDDCASISADVDATLASLMVRLNGEPLVVSLSEGETSLGRAVDVLIDGDSLASVVFRYMYSAQRVRLIPGVLDGLDRGHEPTARFLARDSVELSIASLLSNDDGTYLAVTCADRRESAHGVPDDASDFAAAVAGPGIDTICQDWDQPAAEPLASEPVVSDLPTLLLAGQFDPITPPLYAERTAENLSASTVVIRDALAHGIWVGDECIGSIVDDFVADPLRTLDTSCADEELRLNWRRPA